MKIHLVCNPQITQYLSNKEQEISIQSALIVILTTKNSTEQVQF